MDGRGDGGEHDGRVSRGRGRRRHGGRALTPVAAMAELVVVQAASELSLLEVGGDVLVGHLLKSGLEQIDFLYRGGNISTCACLPSHMALEVPPPFSHKSRTTHTSSSLQALPPPVDEFLRWCFVIPYSWRSITSDVGVYMAECMAIVMVGDMILQVVGSKELK